MNDANIENLAQAINANATDVTKQDTKAVESDEVKKPNWLDSMPEDLRENQSLSKFSNYEELAKKYLELESDIEKRISLPTDDSSDEEWQKIFSKLGMPEDKKYISDERKSELMSKKLVDQDTIKLYEDLFHKGNLTKHQSDRLLKQIIENVENSNKQHLDAQHKAREDNFNKFQQKYGDALNEKLNILKATMQKHGSDELVSLVEESNYSPILIDLLLKLGNKSDTLISGKSEKSIASKEEALKEIRRLESDDGFMSKYNNKEHAGYEQAIENMRRLYDLAYNK